MASRRAVLAALQGGLARLAGLSLLAAAGVLGLGLAERAVPPERAPWKPLSLADPVGPATRFKVARIGGEPEQCRAVLRRAGVPFTPVASRGAGPGCAIADAVTLGGAPSLSPARPVLTCREALALAVWRRQVVGPAARDLLGQDVARLDHLGSYACRRIYNRSQGAMSQHATANAIDVAGFRLADGSVVRVRTSWRDSGPRGRFLHRVRDGACAVFGTTLSPDYNAAHADHLHLDMGQTGLCG
jgi:hypothetical protein